MNGDRSYRVRDGAELAHAGEVLTGGAVVQLQPHVGYEVRHLVEPLGDDGKVKPWGTAAEEAFEAELAAARPHERISIIERAIASRTGDLEKLQKMHAAEVKANEAATKALEKKNAKGDEPKSKPTPPAAGTQG